MNNLKTTTITHELDKAKDKKAFCKMADRDYKVKVIFKLGVYDDEATVTGYKDDVSAFVGFFKTNYVNA